MNKEKDNYFFHLNWADNHKNQYRVGLLAQVAQSFYFVIKDEKNAESAYKRGFVGISGFKTNKIYKSDELFDFFKSRILNKSNSNVCEQLIETNGTSMVDSFSLEEINGKLAKKYADVLLSAYSIQQRKEKLRKNRTKYVGRRTQNEEKAI